MEKVEKVALCSHMNSDSEAAKINHALLLEFYGERDPDKIANIETILQKFSPQKMVEIFTKKYGEAPLFAGSNLNPAVVAETKTTKQHETTVEDVEDLPSEQTSPPVDGSNISLHGFMWKKGGNRNAFSRRWFRLHHYNLFYYKTRINADGKGTPKALGIIPLARVTQVLDGKRVDKDGGKKPPWVDYLPLVAPHFFLLMTPGRTWVLASETKDEYQDWYGTLRRVVGLVKYSQQVLHVAMPNHTTEQAAGEEVNSGGLFGRVYAGPLQKRRYGFAHMWKTKHFILQNRCLTCHARMYGPVKGVYFLSGSAVEKVMITKTHSKAKNMHSFELRIERTNREKDVLALRCDSVKIRDAWVDHLDAAWITKDGNTALQQIAREGHTDRVADLVKVGALVSLANSDGWTPLHTAAASGQLGAVAALIRFNASIEAKCNLGNTCLHQAAMNGHPLVMTELRRAGADLNSTSTAGWTAAMFAAAGAYVSQPDKHSIILQLLAKAGADMSLTNDNDVTALQILDQSKVRAKDWKGKGTMTDAVNATKVESSSTKEELPIKISSTSPKMPSTAFAEDERPTETVGMECEEEKAGRDSEKRSSKRTLAQKRLSAVSFLKFEREKVTSENVQLGQRVSRGLDWNSGGGNEDGGPGVEHWGTVVGYYRADKKEYDGEAPNFADMCTVQWNTTGKIGEYKTGRRGKYQLTQAETATNKQASAHSNSNKSVFDL